MNHYFYLQYNIIFSFWISRFVLVLAPLDVPLYFWSEEERGQEVIDGLFLPSMVERKRWKTKTRGIPLIFSLHFFAFCFFIPSRVLSFPVGACSLDLLAWDLTFWKRMFGNVFVSALFLFFFNLAMFHANALV